MTTIIGRNAGQAGTPASVGGNAVIRLAAGFARACAAEWRRRRHLRELRRLDERTLHDIGLVRTATGFENSTSIGTDTSPAKG